jgi:Dolichyl-phosphate-mannose-protein mannosyltransferase
MDRRWVEALAVGLALALFAWRELAAMAADGVTRDEPAHLAYGERGLTRGEFGRERDVLNSKMPVSVLNALPVVAAARLGGPAAPPDDAARRVWLGRLPTVALGLGLGWLVFAWARALFGFGGGALALWLYTCCPNVLAHSHLITTDVATALGIFGATYAFWRYRRQPGRGRLAVAAAAFGAAQLTKATALFLVPIFLLIVLLEAFRGSLAARRRRLAAGAAEPGGQAGEGEEAGRAVRRVVAPGTAPAPVAALTTAAVFAAGAVLALNLGFAGEKTLTPLSRYSPVSRPFQALAAMPVLRAVPIPLPLPYLAGLDMVARDARAGTPSYLRGRFSAHGFWDYYLVAALLKMPLGTLALLALAAWLAVTGRVRAPDAEAFLLVPAAFLLAYLSFAFELQIGLRYLLPAFPFLFVFAGRAAAWRPPASAFGILVALLAGWTAGSSWSVHPHYIPYFNELIGDRRNGYRWLIASNLDWGQDDRYVREVYARRGPVRVWVEPSGPIAGRVAVAVTTLVGEHAWLREHFRPVAMVHGSWAVFDVAQEEIDRCCADLTPAWAVPDDAGDLALGGRPIGGAVGDREGTGAGVRRLDRINDGMLGSNSERDAARTWASSSPVSAWFGIAWERPQRIGRVVAYPGFFSRGSGSHRFLATDYVLQWWDGRDWIDLPGTRTAGNRRLHVEHRFPPVRTTRLRLLVERELNQRGTEETPSVFCAACLELAVYPP